MASAALVSRKCLSFSGITFPDSRNPLLNAKSFTVGFAEKERAFFPTDFEIIAPGNLVVAQVY